MQGMKPKVHPTADAASKAGVGGGYHPVSKAPSLGASFAATPAQQLEHPAQQQINMLTSPHGPTHAQLAQVLATLPAPHPQVSLPAVASPMAHAMVPMPMVPVAAPHPMGADVAARLLALRAMLGGGR